MSWIKVRTNLISDPRVMFMARQLKASKQQVLGGLVEVWSYADAHSVDGLLKLVTEEGIDEMVGMSGFVNAMIGIEWAEVKPNGVRLLKYDEHNGQTAKRRMQVSAAVARHRMRKDTTLKPSDGSELVTREEKSREEKKGERGEKGARRKGANGWM